MNRVQTAPVLNLANAVTFARLCAAPVAVWLVLHSRYGVAFVVFAAAGMSDALDGWLARRNGGSALGALLDPLADKALLIGMFVTLAVMGLLPDWIAILVVFRDGLIVGGVVLLRLSGTAVPIRPLLLSKVATALQLLLVGTTLLLAGLGGAVPRLLGSLPWALTWALTWAATAAALVSAGAYVRRAAR